MSDDFQTANDDDIEKLLDFLQQGGTVQELYGMEDSDVDVMFVSASRYLQQEQFEEAADAFLFLTLLNPYQGKFWMGLGESHRLQKEFDLALQNYKMAAVYDSKNPKPYFHQANCYIANDKPEKALEKLELCLEHCQGKSAFKSMQEVCYELVDDLKTRIENKR